MPSDPKEYVWFLYYITDINALFKKKNQQSGLKFPDHIRIGQGSILAEGSILPECTLHESSICPLFKNVKNSNNNEDIGTYKT